MEVGQTITTYDVPAVVAAGRNPIIPVVVMEKEAAAISFTDAVIADLVAAREPLLTAR